MASLPIVDILLSTYNGAQFLPELLISLERQSFRQFRLLMRDDGSSDACAKLLEGFAKKAPFECVLLPSSGNLGALGSFNRLIEASSAPYVMFCDQDDVWLPEKTGKSVEAIKSLESQLGPGIPALAHCDLTVVDENLSVLSQSLWETQRLDPIRRTSLAAQLVQNSVTGCATIANRPLLKAACPIPSKAVMHDWYLAIAAAALGKIKPIPDKLILYRQHGGNSLGAADFNSMLSLCSLFLKKAPLRRFGIEAMFEQAQAASSSIQGLPPESNRLICEFASIPSRGAFERRAILVKSGFLKSGWTRNLCFLALV